MRVVVVTAGTRGDVEPLLALALGLRGAGHDVRLATHAPFAAAAAARELPFTPLPGDPVLLFDDPAWASFALSPRRPFTHARTLHTVVDALVGPLGPDVLRPALADAEAVVFTPTVSAAAVVADELGIRRVCAALTPFARTGAFPQPVLAPALRLGAVANRLSYPVAERLLHAPFQEPLRPAARRRAGLATLPFGAPTRAWPPFPVVHGFSPALLPRPVDWPAQITAAGWWPLAPAPGDGLGEELEAFLAAGPAPLFVGFGSLRPPEPTRTLAVLAEALRRTGRRAVVQGDWLAPLAGEGVFLAAAVPHALLLPRVCAVVHHGGAGTVAAGLRAGRATFVAPLGFDQAFWGVRVARAGAGPAPIPLARLGADALVAAIDALGKEPVRAAAAALGARMAREDGVGAAVRTIEATLATGP